MHSSWFSYPISRPYPFRWFTPVTLVGGVVLAVLFTLINLGSSGFYLKSEFTSDPNSTISGQLQWFMKPPFSGENSLEPKCEPKMLSVGDSFFTSRLGFQYTIKSLRRFNESDESMETLPSIPYLNNTLEDCFLDRASLKLIKSDAIGSRTWWISWSAASTVEATAACRIMTQHGRINISLALQYQGRADHLYGLLNAYLAGVWQIMALTQQVSGAKDDHYWAFGDIAYIRNLSEQNIRTIDFFKSDAWIASSHGRIVTTSMVVVDSPLGFANDFSATKNLTYLFENPKDPLSPVTTEGLHYAKLLHSLISIDLGNCQAPNLLLSDDGLKYAIDAPDSPNRKPKKDLDCGTRNYKGSMDRYCKIPRPYTFYDKNLTFLNDTYDEFRPLTGKRGCKNSTIVAQYLCSVPESKSAGTMILAIVIANLVFLQAAWRLLGLAAQAMLPNADPDAMICEGCLKGNKAMEQVSSRPVSRNSGTDSGDESTAQLVQR
ncbi:uncharacterized protein NECHADRAFT_101122 [Fusarium vanettenii 77-13-4]|uniref:Uncharacterized protein n=1 Tax=Fusarium vanettenii (strain ATCC MYA-4622 / CBS 123669 / FGSC 9596 / NRRL 45880 / 77-13-4) TaxID=660122 RepID=C7YX41_FUSV7|nr:uncharacterized protein NECHADRAFT_101122 [Fusarium vanettenii 77-13-4]EEU43519.1 predicted protein [Fusarium vanettenii 77-13-4]